MHYYNIHDIIKLKSDINLQELDYFVTKEFADPDITLGVISFSEDPDMSKLRIKRKMLVENDFHQSSAYTIKYTEQFGSAGAQFKIRFDKSKIHIAINKLISKSKHVTYVNLVEPLLRFLFLSKGYVLLHSACMSVPKGNGFFLSAPPDTGKTTTVIKCVKRGYSFLSDDMTIIQLPNTAICFPKSMTISAHTYKTAAEATTEDENSDKKDKKGMKIRSLVHSKTGRSFMHKLAEYNVPIFTINTIGQSRIKPPKYHIRDIIKEAKIQDKTTIDSLFFLEKGLEEEKIEVMEKISIEQALGQAIENSDDAFLFPPYSDLIKHIKIDGKTAYDLLENEKFMMKELLSTIDCFILKSSSRNWSEMILEKFKN